MEAQEHTVLIIDDSAEDRLLYRESLASEYTILEAETGEQGLQLYRTYRPECLLLDYRLPRMDGLQVLEALTREFGKHACAIVLLTIRSYQDVAIRALQCGAHDYLDKDRLTQTALRRALAEAREKVALHNAGQHAEARLRESERRLSLALEAAAMGVWTWDLRTQHVTWSPEHYQIFAVTTYDGTPEGFGRFLHPEDAERVWATVHAAIRDRTLYEAEFRIVRGDGTVRWVANRGRAEYDASGQPVRMLGICADIHHRKVAELGVQRHTEGLRLLAEAAADLLAAADPNRMVEALFHKVGAYLGADIFFHYMLDDTAAAGTPPLRLDAAGGISTATRAAFARLNMGQALCGVSAEERRSISLQNVQHSQDPRARDIQGLGVRAYACHPLFAGARLLGTLSFGSRTKDCFTDDELDFIATISHYVAIAKERLRAETILRDMNTTLEQRVAERSTALEQAMAERQRLERAAQRAEHFALLGRLAAGVSHEIRNPLSALFLHVDLLEEELHESVPHRPPGVVEALAEIKMNLARVEDLIEDYLSLVRVGTLERQPQDVSAALQVWVADFQRMAEACNVQLVAQGLAHLGVLSFHASTLQRALLNLVQNALDAMPSGGRLTVQGQGTASHVRVQICDSGYGISTAQLPRIFEPLYTTKPGGTGLGLYIVQQIIMAHDGQIDVESSTGQGTTFTITLPR